MVTISDEWLLKSNDVLIGDCDSAKNSRWAGVGTELNYRKVKIENTDNFLVGS